MNVKIDDLLLITSLLLSKLKEEKGNEIEINNDFYWDISNEEIYNPYKEPENITLGQISDDLEELQGLLKSKEAFSYDLKRLSSIFKVLSLENITAF